MIVRYLFFYLALLPQLLWGQHVFTLEDEIKEALGTKNQQSVSLFSSIKHVKNSFALDKIEATLLYENKAKFISLAIPLKKGEIRLDLLQKSVFSNQFFGELSSGEAFTEELPVTYRGIIHGRPNSIATLVVTSKDVRVMYADENGTFEINKINDAYSLTKVSDVKSSPYDCETLDDGIVSNHGKIGNRASFGDCLELHISVDYNLYQLNGSSVPNATAYLTAVFNDVATIYANYGVVLVIRSTKIYNTSDNFDGTSLLTLKNSFVAYNQTNGFLGTVAYLMSGRSLSGGISHGIGGFCNNISLYPGPLALSSSMTVPNVAYPVYSYNVYNVSHELGHVLGLRHSHACVWNGNNTQIDDCGNVWAQDNNATPEGTDCFNAAAPILPGNNGTIMSYCQLLQGSGINLATGFGPIAGQVLVSNYINAPCYTGQSCGTTAPGNDDCIKAYPITLKNICRGRTFDNDFATASGNTPGFSCGSTGTTLDVWFTCIVPASGSMTFETLDSPIPDLNDMVVQAYSGTCGALVAISCDDNNGAGNHSQIILTGRTPGEKIYFRVIDSGSNNSGEFDVCAYDASVPCHPDLSTMVSFYNSTGGPSWTNKTGWQAGAAGSDCSVCAWYGVVCDANDRVIEINLGSNNLSGTIPSSLTQLTTLQKLSVYSNNLAGPLPTFFNQFPLLSFLDLGNNDYTGSIPSTIALIPNIQVLFLDLNLLSGSLLASLGNTEISTLWLNNNNFTGCIPHQYLSFCTNDAFVRLEGNVGLPFGGNYDMFCLNGAGDDSDGDGYCAGSQDCYDNDPLSYPGAAEYCDGNDNDCDGMVDEGVALANITWTGVQNNLWSNPSNWNPMRMPQPCNNVIIQPASLDTVIISTATVAKAASVLNQANSLLNIQSSASLNINNNGALTNYGNTRITGSLNISGNVASAPTALINYGSITINPNGNIAIDNYYATGIQNQVGGTITNQGQIFLNTNSASQGLYGIFNFGTVNNTGFINTLNIVGRDIYNKVNSLFHNYETGQIDLR